MGSKKRLRAEQASEEKKNKYFAVLKNCPTSPRKMRLVADQIRGVDVNSALDHLRFSPKDASGKLEKLLKSAIANWEVKNENARMEDADLFVKEIFVDSGRVLKRLRPAPQGRAHRIRKRSNHVTLILGSASDIVSQEVVETQDIQTKE